jgi:hypothetical protein
MNEGSSEESDKTGETVEGSDQSFTGSNDATSRARARNCKGR